jgi:hypothetical protein
MEAHGSREASHGAIYIASLGDIEAHSWVVVAHSGVMEAHSGAMEAHPRVRGGFLSLFLPLSRSHSNCLSVSLYISLNLSLPLFLFLSLSLPSFSFLPLSLFWTKVLNIALYLSKLSLSLAVPYESSPDPVRTL